MRYFFFIFSTFFLPIFFFCVIFSHLLWFWYYYTLFLSPRGVKKERLEEWLEMKKEIIRWKLLVIPIMSRNEGVFITNQIQIKGIHFFHGCLSTSLHFHTLLHYDLWCLCGLPRRSKGEVGGRRGDREERRRRRRRREKPHFLKNFTDFRLWFLKWYSSFLIPCRCIVV